MEFEDERSCEKPDQVVSGAFRKQTMRKEFYENVKTLNFYKGAVDIGHKFAQNK